MHACMYVYHVSLVYVSFLLNIINFLFSFVVAEERAKLQMEEGETGEKEAAVRESGVAGGAEGEKESIDVYSFAVSY